MPNPNDRRRIAAAHRNRFDAQYAEFIETLEPDTYTAEDVIDGFLIHFERPIYFETRDEIRGELVERGLIDDEGNVMILDDDY